MINVIDHNKFRLFDYENVPSDVFALGNVLYKEYPKEYEQLPEVGVVIQTYGNECRTDMWGMCSLSEVRAATLKDIENLRPNLLQDIIN